jgi:predicted PhzF superfamily epimerase YddE/YHI9
VTIDCHTHFYDPTRPEGAPWPPADDVVLYRRVLPEDFRRVAEPLGVAGTVVVEASAWLEDNQWVLDLAEQDRAIVGFVGRLAPSSPDFGVHLSRFARNRFDYVAEVPSERAVRAVRPDFGLLAEIACRGVIVTSVADDAAYDFVSRFFAPRAGIPEDPVTGSAHCCLGPFWADRLGKRELVGYPASPRGGVVRVRVGEERVLLGGGAVTVFRGVLRSP